MPAADLTPEQKARNAQGLCACGCGRHLPGDANWRNIHYADDETGSTTACRSRAYRERRNAGRVRPAEMRKRAKMKEEAENLQRHAEYLRRSAASQLRDAERLEYQAGQLLERAAGQLSVIDRIAPKPARARDEDPELDEDGDDFDEESDFDEDDDDEDLATIPTTHRAGAGAV